MRRTVVNTSNSQSILSECLSILWISFIILKFLKSSSWCKGLCIYSFASIMDVQSRRASSKIHIDPFKMALFRCKAQVRMFYSCSLAFLHCFVSCLQLVYLRKSTFSSCEGLYMLVAIAHISYRGLQQKPQDLCHLSVSCNMYNSYPCYKLACLWLSCGSKSLYIV